MWNTIQKCNVNFLEKFNDLSLIKNKTNNKKRNLWKWRNREFKIQYL